MLPVNKILKGLQEANAFAHCEHEWQSVQRDTEDGVTLTRATCSKCGCRVSEFLEAGQKTEIEG